MIAFVITVFLRESLRRFADLADCTGAAKIVTGLTPIKIATRPMLIAGSSLGKSSLLVIPQVYRRNLRGTTRRNLCVRRLDGDLFNNLLTARPSTQRSRGELN